MLIDTTLREGAQLFGAYFDLSMREKIVSGLLALGVNELELGWVGQEDLETLVRNTRSRAGSTVLSVWSPCRETDIRRAAALGADRVNIGVPVSDAHMEKRLGLGREGLLEKLASTVLAASLLHIPYISIGLEDVSRADPEFALRAAITAAAMGASRIRLSDSVGVLTPTATRKLVRTFREKINTEIAVHCHNDFGMATANAITALESGADYVDASVLGIGERSGIAATEEVVACLTLKEERYAYRTDGLKDLCHLVSGAAGIPIARNKAVAGADIFCCESGLHAHALSKSPELFEPYDPAKVGADRRVAVGGKSGRSAVASALAGSGLDFPAAELPGLVRAVKELSWALGRPLTPREFVELTASKDLN